MESFFHSLKVEQVNDCRYLTREDARADVFEYIETYYNTVRRHSTLNYLSPRDLENQKAA
jgi:putative transposase